MPGELQVPDSETLWNTKGRGYNPGLFHFEHHLAHGAFVVGGRDYSPQGIVAKTMERQYPGLRKALDGILDRMRDSCKDTGDCIRYALELEQAILQWYSEQTDVQQRRKKDESITKNSLDTAKVSLDALASMLNASSLALIHI